MTNEEKAREIARKWEYNHGGFDETAYLAAMQMAQWKDEQFAKKIEQIKKNIILARDNNEYYKPKLEVALDWILRLIDEINKDN